VYKRRICGFFMRNALPFRYGRVSKAAARPALSACFKSSQNLRKLGK
jgi:hypothetical protein